MMSPSSHHVLIALGSNSDAENNLALALNSMKRFIDMDKKSTAIWTEPVGIVSPPFFNMLVEGHTCLRLEQLKHKLKELETETHRKEIQEKNKQLISLDLDILLFDNEKLHPQDWQRDYVQILLKEIQSTITN